jgi:hypothetical protein
MLDIPEFRITRRLASVFTPDLAIGNKLELINLFQETSNNKFDGELLSFPVPQDAPSEIPRVILQSKDGRWKVEISLERTNILFLRSEDLSKPVLNLEDFSNFVTPLFSSYKDKFNLRIQRLALVTEKVAKIEGESPAQYIASRYCKEEFVKKAFHKTQSFEIHSLKKYEWRGFNVNSWVRIKTAKLPKVSSVPLLLMINDINTLSQLEAPDMNFTKDDMFKFYSNIPQEITEILSLYF